MPYRPPKKQPEFADLKGILAQSKVHLDHATYQTIQILIERLQRFQNIINELLDPEDPDSPIAGKFETYITSENESASLPNSRQLIAGTGITLDDSVVNELTISSTAGNVYDSPLTDGDLIETHLIFADGDPVIVQVPV